MLISASIHPCCTKNGAPSAKGLHLEIRWSKAAADSTAGLAWLSNLNVIVADEELCRALIRAANDRQQARNLAPRDQPQRPTLGAGQHGPIGVVVVAHVPGIFQHEHRPRLHL